MKFKEGGREQFPDCLVGPLPGSAKRSTGEGGHKQFPDFWARSFRLSGMKFEGGGREQSPDFLVGSLPGVS